MNRNYIYLTVLMLLLASGTLLLTGEDEPKQTDPEKLLQEIIQPTRYLTTDQVAKMIIQVDPSLMLIDVRSEEEFKRFSLPNAHNVPLDSIMSRDYQSYFGIPGTKVVFVSNDDLKADQTWVLTKRLGFQGTYVMKGGLNGWMRTIIDPQEPASEEPNTAFETYTSRKGAQIYFTGAPADETQSSKLNIEIKRREKTSVAGGGC